MFLDASIIVAILAEEEGWEELFAELRELKAPLYFSAIVRFEAVTAISRLSQAARGSRTNAASLLEAGTVFDDFIQATGAQEIDISPEIGRSAMLAARSYGKFVGHKAGLNFGDCFSYAAAKSLGVGLLYKGNDFAFTDLG